MAKEIKITKEMIEKKEVEYVYWADETGDYGYFQEVIIGLDKILKKWNLTIDYGYYENDCEQDEWYVKIKPIN